MAGSLVQPLISSVVKGVGGRRIKKAGRIYMDKIFFFNYEPRIGQKIVRLAPLSPLFNVGCKFAWSFFPTTTDWHIFYRLEQEKRGKSGYLWASLTFFKNFFYENIVSLNDFCDWLTTKLVNLGVDSNALSALHRSQKIDMTRFLVNRYCLCVLLICDGSWWAGIKTYFKFD